MNRIVERTPLNHRYTELIIAAPLAAKKVQPGQFAIFRPTQESERFPLMIADYDRSAGTLTFLYEHEDTTAGLDALPVGASLYSLTAPLGKPSQLTEARLVCIAAHGFGCAAALPVARRLHDAGCEVHAMLGFDSADEAILLQEFEDCSASLGVMTLDGSLAAHYSVPDAVEEMLLAGYRYDAVFAAGPLSVMKAVCNVTQLYHLRTIVTLNPIMMDGTGMCGCCRVTVNGKRMLACVDGPEFDGHAVDFDELIRREDIMNRQAVLSQLHAMHRDERCNLLREVR